MEYKDIEKVNSEMTTTDIKGKDYVEVNQRIKAFRKLYPEGFIRTRIEELKDGICTMSASVGYYQIVSAMRIEIELATGTAQEKENSSFINKTSYIENCETSAVGRALGMLGLGIDTSVASAEEVQNAIVNQEPTEEDAKKWKFSFGKYKDKSMIEIAADDEDYMKWYLNNKASEYDKKCYEILTGEKLPTDEELDTNIQLIHDINELELETDTDHETMLNHFKVNSLNEMTTAQLIECKKILEKKRG